MAARYKLTDKAVRAIKDQGRHSDGGRLHLVVGKTGSKSWLFLFRWKDNPNAKGPGRQREMGLGSLKDVSLARARQLAEQASERLAAGHDPIRHRRSASSTPEVSPSKTFGEAADAYIKGQEAGWKNEAHRARWRRVTGDSYCRAIRAKPVDTITTEDVLAILTPIWIKKSETAKRVRIAIEVVLDYAKARKWRTGENPALWRGHLKMMLAKRPKLTRGHHRALPWRELPAFMTTLRAGRRSISSLALEYTILTVARSEETLGAPWTEVDLGMGVWTLPPERWKEGLTGNEPRWHRMPLTPRAIEILKISQKFGSPWLFPGRGAEGRLSESAMAEHLKHFNVHATVHGFRSTFRDWAGDSTEHPRVIAEAALGHLVGDEAERSYRRGDALDRRRKLMLEWENYCGSGVSGKRPA